MRRARLIATLATAQRGGFLTFYPPHYRKEVGHEALHFGVGSSGGYGGNDGRMVVTVAPALDTCATATKAKRGRRTSRRTRRLYK
jgi:hypothetical protein